MSAALRTAGLFAAIACLGGFALWLCSTPQHVLLVVVVFVAALGGAAWQLQLDHWEDRVQRLGFKSAVVSGTVILARAASAIATDDTILTDAQQDFSQGWQRLLVAALILVLSPGPVALEVVLVVVGAVLILVPPMFLGRRPRNRGDDHSATAVGLVGSSSKRGGSQGLEAAPLDSLSRVERNELLSAEETYCADSPPMLVHYSGREEELDLLSRRESALYCITGIGGQGKSSLAAAALANARTDELLEFWDWRNCREQKASFRTHLTAALHRITGGSLTPAMLDGASAEWLVAAFFRHAGDLNGVLVFDNVDGYVDSQSGVLTDVLAEFAREATRVEHQLSIILTCRPRIGEESPRMAEVHLTGLRQAEAARIFDGHFGGRIPDPIRSAIPEIVERTSGHPFWLQLICRQLTRDSSRPTDIVSALRSLDNSESGIPYAYFRNLWTELNDRDQTVLRCLAALPRGCRKSDFYELVKDEFTNKNRFNKSFSACLRAGLITEARSAHDTYGQFEIHPIVRAYIRSEYRDSDELQQVTSSMLGSARQQLAKRQPATATLSDLQVTSLFVELASYAGKAELGVRELVACANRYRVLGLAEEFTRIASKCLSLIDLKALKHIQPDIAVTASQHLVGMLDDLDETEAADRHIEYCRAGVRSGTPAEIGVLEMEAMSAWTRGEFDRAVTLADEGVALKTSAGLDTDFDSSNVLGLALRDGGDIDRALEVFSRGLTFEALLSEDHRSGKRDAAVYGNIGRTLQIAGRNEEALQFVARAFDILTTDTDGEHRINVGYAAFWIAEVSPENAGPFAALAVRTWTACAPARLALLPENILQLADGFDGPDERLIPRCRRALRPVLKRD